MSDEMVMYEAAQNETLSKDLVPAIVNQKLAFARILLKAAKREASDDIENRLHQHAFLDSALTQLHTCLRFFVEEVTGVSAKTTIKLTLNTGLVVALAGALQAHPHSPELKEIQILIDDKQSWLSRLLYVLGHPHGLLKYFLDTSDSSLALPETESRDSEKSDDVVHNQAINAVLIGSIQLPENPMDIMQPVVLVEHFLNNTQNLIERLRYSVVED